MTGMKRVMTDFHEAFKCIKPIDDMNSGFNLTDSTRSYGFHASWDLGGDIGHSDFCYWLDGNMSFTHRDVCAAVYQSFLAAATDKIRAYDTHVLFALNLYALAGKPERYFPDDSLEDEEYRDPLNDKDYVKWLGLKSQEKIQAPLQCGPP
uniref:Uncharacterized protein n=1 Tax=viral metagenome TaxID=1070528 RepID=A0A6C0JBQ2_9ZZZZ